MLYLCHPVAPLLGRLRRPGQRMCDSLLSTALGRKRFTNYRQGACTCESNILRAVLTCDDANFRTVITARRYGNAEATETRKRNPRGYNVTWPFFPDPRGFRYFPAVNCTMLDSTNTECGGLCNITITTGEGVVFPNLYDSPGATFNFNCQAKTCTNWC